MTELDDALFKTENGVLCKEEKNLSENPQRKAAMRFCF